MSISSQKTVTNEFYVLVPHIYSLTSVIQNGRWPKEWRLPRQKSKLQKAKEQAINLLMIGTNNTGHRMDPAEHTAKGISAIVSELRNRLPGTIILLLAIFPRHHSPANEMRLHNDHINKLISTLAKK